MPRLPPSSTLFPYTTLFRSLIGPAHGHVQLVRAGGERQLGARLVGSAAATQRIRQGEPAGHRVRTPRGHHHGRDRKSTRLNSSHTVISYAVFCLKKKKKRDK